jgi:hypothetical protein
VDTTRPSHPVRYVVLKYRPQPEFGELGNQGNLGVVIFPSKPTSAAQVWVRSNLYSFVICFGREDDIDWINKFLNELSAGLSNCAQPEKVVHRLRNVMEAEADVLLFSEVKEMYGEAGVAQANAVVAIQLGCAQPWSARDSTTVDHALRLHPIVA